MLPDVDEAVRLQDPTPRGQRGSCPRMNTNDWVEMFDPYESVKHDDLETNLPKDHVDQYIDVAPTPPR